MLCTDIGLQKACEAVPTNTLESKEYSMFVDVENLVHMIPVIYFRIASMSHTKYVI